MTNGKFQNLLDRLGCANNKYKKLLIQAENEYESRYGINPSDNNDDFWIDTFHIGLSGHVTVLQIEKESGR